MEQKIGEELFQDMKQRGFREIGGFFFPDSNIAQPMYPLRGSYGPAKDADGPKLDEHEPSFEELHPVGPGRDDGPDNPNRGMDRE